VNRTRTAELARGAAAAVVIAAVVVVPPVLLLRFIGWPLPHSPNVDDIAHSLRGTPISDQVLLKALAIAGWVAWANAFACLVAEVVAWRRQRTATHVPLGGLFQPLISQLVLSAGLLLTTARTLTPAPTTAAIQLRPAVLTVAVQEIPAATPTPEASTELPTCVVQRRDSLWVLAERHLGDGLRWREIYDLNQGLPQPAGRTLRDPNLILPGWTLRLPADAVGVVPPAPAPVSVSPVSPAPATEAPPTNPSPSVPIPPSTSAPEIPAPSTTAPTVASTSAPPTSGPAPARDPATNADDDADDHFPVPAALAGATLLAAAMVLKIDALRRRQMRRRPPGHTIPPASGDASNAERLLRAAAAKKPASRLDFALRLLAHQLADSDANDCRVESVRVADDAIEILLTSTTDAPAGPFEVTGGRAWTLRADVISPELEDRAARQTAPAPALVTVGRLGDADVLVDLETSPLTVAGHTETARRVLWSITTELATSPWADDLQVLYVGSPPPGVAGLDRVEVFPTVAGAAQAVAKRSAATTRALASAGHGDAWSARLANHGDGWPPIIVIIGGDEADEVPGASVVRVADHDVHGERTLLVDDQRCRLEPLGLDLTLPGLPAELIEPAQELIATALADEPGPEIDLRVPVVARYVAPLELREADDITPATDGVVLVRILGPVVIDGAPSVNRRRVKELIVYLAIHPDGVTTEQITAALWPGDTPSRAAFNQTVTRARAALGDDPDGQPYIGYVHDGRYRPSRYLLCDAILLERAVASEVSEDFVEPTGQPFAATPGFEWAYVEGHAYRASALLEQLHSVRSSDLSPRAAR
jgi:hypothetical protein